MTKSLADIRQDKIRSFIEEQSVVTIHELEELCPDVSLMTIHRDLDALEEEGFVTKFRGGARSVRHAHDVLLGTREQENREGKEAIAERAISLIPANSAIFLDAGTTNLMLARHFPDIPLSVVTTSPAIALELAKKEHPTITLCCGTLHRRNMALSGQNTLDMLDSVNIDVAFLGVSGCSVEAGFTCGTEADMRVKRLVIEKARKSVVLCDQTKFNRLMPYTFCAIEEPDCLLCDVKPPEKVLRVARAGKVEVVYS